MTFAKGPHAHVPGRSGQWRKVRIALEVMVTTDREPEEYGIALAQYLAAEINDANGMDSPIPLATVSCYETDVLC
jgi:hypothetical protein